MDLDVKKALIGTIIIVLLLNLNLGSSQLSLTSDDVFTELKVNEPTGRSIITINSPEKVDINKFGLRFIAKCGIVKSYTLKVKSLCEKEIPIYKTVEVCGEMNKTTGEKCHYENKIIGTTKTMETCYKYTDYIEGEQDYEIEADIISTKCDDNTYGYHIDWIPSMEIDGKEIEQPKWALWNGTGGTITYDGLYTVHTFTSNSTFNWTGDDMSITLAIISGGGSGGGCPDGYCGAGGGAGGLYLNTTYLITDDYIHNITVGTGGVGVTGSTSTPISGNNGTNSKFDGTSTNGGGGGGSGVGGAGRVGWVGGSGGGGGYDNAVGGAGTSGQGYAGGQADTGPANEDINSGGGGGYGTVGQNAADQSYAGDGGSGLNISINGSMANYSCGGGGSSYNEGLGHAGCSGAGIGGSIVPRIDPTSATCFGCGGGASNYYVNSGNGGNGIVIIRYLTYVVPSTLMSEHNLLIVSNQSIMIQYAHNLTINSLSGVGNDYVCINENGTIYRNDSCD